MLEVPAVKGKVMTLFKVKQHDGHLAHTLLFKINQHINSQPSKSFTLSRKQQYCFSLFFNYKHLTNNSYRYSPNIQTIPSFSVCLNVSVLKTSRYFHFFEMEIKIREEIFSTSWSVIVGREVNAGTSHKCHCFCTKRWWIQ